MGKIQGSFRASPSLSVGLSKDEGFVVVVAAAVVDEMLFLFAKLFFGSRSLSQNTMGLSNWPFPSTRPVCGQGGLF